MGAIDWDYLFDLAGKVQPEPAPDPIPAPRRPCAGAGQTSAGAPAGLDLSSDAAVQRALDRLPLSVKVKGFQAYAHLEADGIVGDLTRAALEKALGE